MANLVELECKVCHHKWVPRKSTTPRWCPRCVSTNWATGRVRPPIAEQRAQAALRRAQEDKKKPLKTQRRSTKTSTLPNIHPLSRRLPSAVKMYTLAGVTTAGPWLEVTDNQSELLSSQELLDWQEGDYVLLIDGKDGSCLIGDGIYPNDIVHLRPGIQYENGDIVHASGLDSAGRAFATLKHIYHKKGSKTVELRPSNGHNPAIVAPAAKLTIHGVLIGFTHRGRIRRSMV